MGVCCPGAHSEVPPSLGRRVVGGFDTLTAMENVESDPKTDRPKVCAAGEPRERDGPGWAPGRAPGRWVWRGPLPPAARSLASFRC